MLWHKTHFAAQWVCFAGGNTKSSTQSSWADHAYRTNRTNRPLLLTSWLQNSEMQLTAKIILELASCQKSESQKLLWLPTHARPSSLLLKQTHENMNNSWGHLHRSHRVKSVASISRSRIVDLLKQKGAMDSVRQRTKST